MKTARVKEPLIAMMLTIIFPGLGQAYCGRIKRGIYALIFLALFAIIPTAYFFIPATKITLLLLPPLICFFAVYLYLIIDARSCAIDYNTMNDRVRFIKIGTRLLLLLGIISSVFVNPITIAVCRVSSYIKTNLAQAFEIPEGTMQPTLIQGDLILVDKITYKTMPPSRGDVVVFRHPGNNNIIAVKRVAGLPNETIEIKDGKIMINGSELKGQGVLATFFYHNKGGYGRKGEALNIPADSYYVLDDNSLLNEDSRFWGFVPKENLIGRAYKIYFPFERSGPIN